MNCEECRQHLLEYLYGELDGKVRVAVELAIEECEDCRRELGALKEMLAAADAWKRLPQPEPSARTSQNILRQARIHAMDKQQRARVPAWLAWAGPAFGVALACVVVIVGVMHNAGRDEPAMPYAISEAESPVAQAAAPAFEERNRNTAAEVADEPSAPSAAAAERETRTAVADSRYDDDFPSAGLPEPDSTVREELRAIAANADRSPNERQLRAEASPPAGRRSTVSGTGGPGAGDGLAQTSALGRLATEPSAEPEPESAATGRSATPLAAAPSAPVEVADIAAVGRGGGGSDSFGLTDQPPAASMQATTGSASLDENTARESDRDIAGRAAENEVAAVARSSAAPARPQRNAREPARSAHAPSPTDYTQQSAVGAAQADPYAYGQRPAPAPAPAPAATPAPPADSVAAEPEAARADDSEGATEDDSSALVSSLLAAGDTSQAVRVSDRLLQQNRSATNIYWAARARIDAGDEVTARRLASELNERFPADVRYDELRERLSSAAPATRSRTRMLDETDR